MKRMIWITALLALLVMSAAAAEELPAFGALTGMDRVQEKLDAGAAFLAVRYGEEEEGAWWETATADPDLMRDLWAALRDIEITGTTDMFVTDSGSRIIFWLDDGTRLTLGFDYEWYAGGRVNYILENAGDFRSLTRMIADRPGDAVLLAAMPVGLGEPALRQCRALINGVDPEKGVIRAVLRMPVTFDGETVRALRPGNVIVGRTAEFDRVIRVETVGELNGGILINGADGELTDGSLWLSADRDGNYRPTDDGDYCWVSLWLRTEMPVSEGMLFLDGIDPATGEELELRTVHDAGAFMRLFDEEANGEGAGPGFAADNVILTFDAEGRVAVIERCYVPWQ